jgi:hypothetical protein
MQDVSVPFLNDHVGTDSCVGESKQAEGGRRERVTGEGTQRHLAPGGSAGETYVYVQSQVVLMCDEVEIPLFTL